MGARKHVSADNLWGGSSVAVLHDNLGAQSACAVDPDVLCARNPGEIPQSAPLLVFATWVRESTSQQTSYGVAPRSLSCMTIWARKALVLLIQMFCVPAAR